MCASEHFLLHPLNASELFLLRSPRLIDTEMQIDHFYCFCSTIHSDFYFSAMINRFSAWALCEIVELELKTKEEVLRVTALFAQCSLRIPFDLLLRLNVSQSTMRWRLNSPELDNLIYIFDWRRRVCV